MNSSIKRFRAVVIFAALCSAGIAPASPIDMWAMSNGGDGNLWSIDVAANTTTLVGRLRDPILLDSNNHVGWSTVAETPDKMLYFLRRYTTAVHVFRLDSTAISVDTQGIITNVVNLGSTGLSGNLDGLTAGPDGNLYFTAFENLTLNTGAPPNGLFRFRPPAPNPCPLCTLGTLAGPPPSPQPGTTELVGTFRTGEFYTDLAFDPINGDLVGTGNPNGNFIPWRLKGSTVLTGNNLLFDYVKAFPNWDRSMYDGLAYNRQTGDLYASGDDSGIYQIDRTTGLIMLDPVTLQKKNVGNNASPTDTRGIGTDLAIQADTIPFADPARVPEPPTLLLVIAALAALGCWQRRPARL